MKRVLGMVGLATMAVATPLLAQGMAPPRPEADGRPHGGHPPAPPLTRADFMGRVDRAFAAMDANHDGALTPGEIADYRYARMRARHKERRDREFAEIDANRDGTVSRAEFEAFRPGMAPPPPGGQDAGPGDRRPGRDGPGRGDEDGVPLMGDHWFAAADANGDGRVTLAEARQFAGGLFDRLDRDHDGTISPEEHFGPEHGRGGPGPQEPDGRGGPDRAGPGGPDGDAPPPPPPQG